MSESKRPNVVIFNTDQWRGDVLGHVGHPAALTPHLDQFVAKDAVSFRNAFSQATVCTPSRCSFMTGWYPHVRGHRTMHHMLRAHHGDPNVLRLLRDNGYFVWWGGKNHFVPGQLGFEAECDVRFQATPEDYERWKHEPRPGMHSWDDWRGKPGSDNYYGFYVGELDTGEDTIYCDKDWADLFGALDFIRSYDGEQPFCLYLALFYPHPPYGVEEPWYSAIDRSLVPPRAPTPDDWSGKPSMLKGISEELNMDGWSEDRWQELRATYCAMVARLDHQFGLLVQALREADLFDDTALFVFSDHGDFTGDYGLVEKAQNTFEDCLTNVPFIVKPPQHLSVKPRVCDALVELVDFPATVFELAGIEPEYSHFSRSLLPLISGETEAHRDAVFSEGGRLIGETHASEGRSLTRWHSDPKDNLYWPRLRLQATDEHPWHTKATMCRTATHKYVRRHYEQDELYDLEADPQELHNVVTDPAYAGILLELKERMLNWYMETCDVVPMDLDQW